MTTTLQEVIIQEHDRQKKQAKAAVLAASAIAEVIRDLGSVPSGHLYAQISDKMGLEYYEGIIAMLVRTGLVKKDGSHLLTWTGPTKEVK